MKHLNLINKWQKQLSDVTSDIKAEALLAQALANGLNEDELLISCSGGLQRPYRKDVLSADVKQDAAHKEYLHVQLSRNGFIDLLPEGLFFTPTNTEYQSAVEMAAAHKANKIKEQNIRRFFIPFEFGFFWQRLQLEREEIGLLNDLLNRMLEDAQFFWPIEPDVPGNFARSLTALLPSAHEIAGNYEVISQCLETILEERVVLKSIINKTGQAPRELLPAFGQQQLGIDTLCGDCFQEESLMIELTIGPLKHSQIQDFLPAGSMEKYIQTFCSFFLPADAEFIIQIELEKQQMALQAGSPELGYGYLGGVTNVKFT